MTLDPHRFGRVAWQDAWAGAGAPASEGPHSARGSTWMRQAFDGSLGLLKHLGHLVKRRFERVVLPIRTNETALADFVILNVRPVRIDVVERPAPGLASNLAQSLFLDYVEGTLGSDAHRIPQRLVVLNLHGDPQL